MYRISHFGFGLACVLLACASPLEPRRKTTFTVHQGVVKPKLSGPAALVSVYGKYNRIPPPDVKAAAASNDGTVAAIPEEYDSEYLSPVNIGGQVLNLDFDTGSADLWVFSTELPTSQLAGHSFYDPAASPSSKKLDGYTWSISYGDRSSASGDVYTDTVRIGSTTVTGQAIELASTISAQFQRDTDNDGLVGLSFDIGNTVRPVKQKTFFTSAKSTLSAPLFTVNLKKGAPGSYDFGYINSTKYNGAITYVNVDTRNGFWEFISNGYAVGSGGFTSASIDAIADTGTSLLYLPPAVVSAYYARVSGASYDSAQGGYTFPCNSTLPSITLGIGRYRAVVPGSYVVYAPVSALTCFGGIQRNTGIGFSILGDIFLKSQFVVFNGAATPQLGFAKKAT